jgi:hypothetical protein
MLRAAFSVCLDGEGVLKALHAFFQILNLALLLGQQEVFYALKSSLHLCAKLFDVLLAGHGAMNHLGQALNGGSVRN